MDTSTSSNAVTADAALPDGAGSESLKLVLHLPTPNKGKKVHTHAYKHNTYICTSLQFTLKWFC